LAAIRCARRIFPGEFGGVGVQRDLRRPVWFAPGAANKEEVLKFHPLSLIVNRWVVALLGSFKFSLELSISLILGLVTNVDQVASRVRISVIAFPVPLRDRHFIWSKLPLRGVGIDDSSKACRRKQGLGLLGTSTARSQG
jgi:hypothetical protein